MDSVFKALGDPTRRALLDSLRERDGQSLTDLESALSMTRFGVMKHLAVLVDENLILTRKVGRFKYHYLNAAPLQSVVDRWIEPLTRVPATRALLDLKAGLEGEAAMQTTLEKPDYMLATFIAASPARVWEALTTAELSRQYYIMGAGFHGTLEVGARYEYRTADGNVMLSGNIIAVEHEKRLEMTFEPHWGNPRVGASRNVYELEAAGSATRLTILHYGLPGGQEGVKDGWAKIVSGLKTLLETGKPLEIG